MGLSDDDKREIREEIRGGFKELYEEQGFTKAEHMQDHEAMHNIRKCSGTIRKASIWTITAFVVSSFLAICWCAMTGKIG